MTNNLKTKFMLLGLFLSMIVFSGCGGVGVAVVDIDGTKNFYEQKLLDGDVYNSGNEEVIKGNEVLYIVFETGENCINMYERIIQLESDKDIDVNVELYENVSFQNAILIKNFNKNRNFEDHSTFEIYNIDDLDVDLINAYRLPSSNFLKGEKKIVTETSDSADYIMKRNTKYALKIINNKNEDADLYFIWTWLECSN